ncbi:hypothetical protein C2S52_007328 [Perilla frutescens var. hirtella]|nr:hypothetical protein C2S52_007328 [Perilla frutescens var. hirtella]
MLFDEVLPRGSKVAAPDSDFEDDVASQVQSEQMDQRTNELRSKFKHDKERVKSKMVRMLEAECNNENIEPLKKKKKVNGYIATPMLCHMDNESLKSIHELDWCEYVIKSLIEHKRMWECNKANSFGWPILFLTAMYVDRVISYGKWLVDRETNGKKHTFDGPSFNLGLTQDWEDVVNISREVGSMPHDEPEAESDVRPEKEDIDKKENTKQHRAHVEDVGRNLRNRKEKVASDAPTHRMVKHKVTSLKRIEAFLSPYHERTVANQNLFFPVLDRDHYYIICFDIRKSDALLIDNSNECKGMDLRPKYGATPFILVFI